MNRIVKKIQTYTVSIAKSLFVVNEKCAIQWAGERVGGGVSGGDGRCLWSIFGGVWCQWISERQEKALDFTVVSKVVWEFTGRMDELVWTSIVTNMNITYKMPHVSTKIYSYIYSMYVQEGLKIKWGWKKKKKKQRRRTVWSPREVFGDNRMWQQPGM